MENALITIPMASVFQVLNDEEITLGSGDLVLLPASETETSLMLMVGATAFKLSKETPFGTVENDSRSYVFSPKLEGVSMGGFVKVVLPEAVTEDGSRLAELQEKFEEVLIEHGLLHPAEDEGEGKRNMKNRVKSAIAVEGAESLVAIPGVVAAQVLGRAEAHPEVQILSEGTLSLLLMPLPGRDQEGEPVFTLVVGASAFPLYKSTAFHALEDDSRTYVFTPDLDGASTGLVAVVLPESDVPDTTAHTASPTDLAALQNQFELALAEHGMLTDSDNLKTNTGLAQRIRTARDSHVAAHGYPPTPQTASIELSDVAQSVADGAAAGVRVAASTVFGVAGAAGKWFSNTFGSSSRKGGEGEVLLRD